MIINLFRNKDDKKSIYDILKNCTYDGILDYSSADEILNPKDGENIKISAGFLDQFGIDEKMRFTQVQRILELLNQISNNKLKKASVVEKKLLEINFKNLNIIDELISKLDNRTYSDKTYEIFKEILFTTGNSEIFKFAIDMTGLHNKCVELIEDYLIIGQAEEYTRYISYVLCGWRDNKVAKEGVFYLLKINSDWGAINIAKMLVLQEDIMQDISNQREILIGALKNNCIRMEIAYYLGSTLNIERLFENAQEDKELMKYLIELFYSLFFETQPNGGLLNLEKDIEYLNLYIDNMEKTEFKTLKLLGLKNIKEFLEDEKNKAFIKKETIESVYNNLKVRVEELWTLTYSIELLRKAIYEKEDIWTWIQYTKANNIVEVIPDFEKVYLESDELKETLETLLIKFGSNEIKEKIYSEFKALYNVGERKKHNYSQNNIIGKQYKEERKIISKIAVLGEVNNNEVLNFIEMLLEDYNPQVRAKAIEVLEIVEEEKIKEKTYLVEKIIKRLVDKPEYISKAAMTLCKNKNIEAQTY